MRAVLSACGATVTYGSVVAVESVSFDVAPGDFFCVVGSNGSGKSSLLRAILGIVPLSGGSVSLGVARERVSYVPQISSIPRDLPATAREVAMTGLQVAGRFSPFYSRSDRAEGAAMFERLGISSVADKRIGDLSGGQRQRVMLARALMRKPELLLLDEPYVGLDEQVRGESRKIIDELGASGGMTVVMVSHDMEDVRRAATRVAVMDRRLLFCGTHREWEEYRKSV